MVTKPKGKLLALLAVFAAIGIVTATGAFTSVQAQRTVTVNTAGDDAALLQLQAATGAPSGVTGASGGEISITLDKINLDATTDLGAVFTITNNAADGSSTSVQIIDDDSEATAGVSTSDVTLDDSSNEIDFETTGAGQGSADTSIEGAAVSLGNGEKVEIQIILNIPDSATAQNDYFNGDIVIYAS